MYGLLQKLAKTFFFAYAQLPLGFHYFQSHILAFIIEKMIRYRVRLAEENISKAFPEKSSAWVKKTRHQFYLHLARVFHEAIWFGGCRDGKHIRKGKKEPGRLRRSRIVEMKNPDIVADLWEKAPGIIILSSHSGNWELSGGITYCNYHDRDNHITEKNYCVGHLRQSSRFWDDFLRYNRTAPLEDPDNFPGYLESREMMRFVITHKTDKLFFNLIADQRPYFNCKDAMRITFMGRPCHAMTGGATAAHKFGMAVVYQHMLVKEDGRGYTLEYETICEDASKMAVPDIIDRYYRLLEGDLRKQPSNYLWTHNRWITF